jgi:hypothetical protein
MREIYEQTDWPASATYIRAKLKEVSGIKDNAYINQIWNIAKNRRFVIEQSKEEWIEGQNKSKWKYNIGPF